MENILDNYAEIRPDTNVYELAHTIIELVETHVYYPTAYIYVPEEKSNLKLDELKRLISMRENIRQNIENNSEQRHLTNDEKYKGFLHETNNIHRQKILDIEKEMINFK